MVLCVLFLLTPVTHGQIVAVRQKFVLSGSVGLPGVTMQGLPGAPTTDENGVYSAEVEYGWKGTVSPVKLGYTFEPKQKVYQKITGNLSEENYSVNVVTYTISGSAGLPGVQMNGLPGDPISDPAGRYTATIEWGWSGSVTPMKQGYRFNPPNKMYNELAKNLTNENYQPNEVTFIISGSVGADGVAMKGLPGNVVTSGGGNYRAQVPYGWSGKITPTKEGHEFSPEFMEYPALESDQANQNYTASVFTFQISGTTNMAGVILKGFPDEPITDTDGYYTAIVPYGWSGKVAPEQAGYTFMPPNKSYTKVTSDYESQDYNPTIIELTISGSAGTSGVTMEGLPGNVVSDATGRYSAKVEFGWAGTVTPTKEGWSIDPPSQIFSPVTSDRLNQKFKAERIKFQVSGNVGLAGVVLEGLPGRVVSGPDGSYSATVNYKFSGKVMPKKSGYTFDPPMMEYSELIFSQTNQDYLPRIIQHTISGQVRDETGPVADIFLLADKDGGSATTDADGKYELLVDHGWRGKITPKSDKYTFTPAMKSLDPVVQNVPNANFIGRIKMLSISNAIIVGDEPFQGVKVTADPGGYATTTDTKGKFTIRVPYGWSGALRFEKEGFDFSAANEIYDNVIENIDKTAPEPSPVPPVPTAPIHRTPSQPAPTQPTTRPVTPPLTETPVEQPVTGDPDRDLLLDEIRRMQKQLDGLTGSGAALPDSEFPDVLPTPGPDQRITTRNAVTLNLVDVLGQLSAKTGVKIAVDATVQPVPVSVGFDPTTMPVPMALQRILEPAGYMYKSMGDDTYLVYRPISNMFQGEDLRQALQDTASMAGVTIVSDPNVGGEVWADIRDVPLETALETMLAGSPFVVTVTPDYYLVADRSVDNPAFAEISETHDVWLNNISPKIAVEHLSTAFERYVKADSDPNSRVVTVTAPTGMAERIVTDLKRLDVRPRHVLLDARVVVMERSDLLDVGVEWGFPNISAGTFGTGFDLENAGAWPWGVQIGYTADQTFTESLLLALNLLQKNGQAEIVSNPQVLAQDGRVSELGVMTEEYYMLTPPSNSGYGYYSSTEMVKIESGTKLVITPKIGDNGYITLEIATEVSDSIPAAAATDLPVVTRRKARNVVTVQDGGTVALAGLTENRSRKVDSKVPGLSNLPLVGGLFKNKDHEGVTKEIAVFVTANLIPETGEMTVGAAPATMPQGVGVQPQRQASAGGDFQQGLRQSLESQPR